MVRRPALKPRLAIGHAAAPAEVGRAARQGMQRNRGNVLE